MERRSVGVMEYYPRLTQRDCITRILEYLASPILLVLLVLLGLLVLLLNRIQPANLHPKLEPKEQRKSGADLLPILLAFHHSKHGGTGSRH